MGPTYHSDFVENVRNETPFAGIRLLLADLSFLLCSVRDLELHTKRKHSSIDLLLGIVQILHKAAVKGKSVYIARGHIKWLALPEDDEIYEVPCIASTVHELKIDVIS